MKKEVYKINKDGFLEEILIKDFKDDGSCIEKLQENIIVVAIPQGLYKPKWIGTEWIETMTKEEYIKTLPKQEPAQPSTEQILLEYVADLDYRLSLKETGV